MEKKGVNNILLYFACHQNARIYHIQADKFILNISGILYDCSYHWFYFGRISLGFHIFSSYHWSHCTWLPSPLSCLLFWLKITGIPFVSFSWLFVKRYFHRKFYFLDIFYSLRAPVLLLLDKVSLTPTQASLSLTLTLHILKSLPLLENSINFWKRHLHVFKPATFWYLTGKERLGSVLPTSLFLRQFAPIHLNFDWPPTRQKEQLFNILISKDIEQQQSNPDTVKS